jgi:hypothetical protein
MWLNFFMGWIALNFAIPAFIIYRRSPHLRHRIFRFTFGGLSPRDELRRAHVWVKAAHRTRYPRR